MSELASKIIQKPILKDEAFYGLIGELVKTIEPYTEADPVALLSNIIVMFGNIIGRSACFKVEDTKHHTNLNAILVGRTSKARKGQSLSTPRRIFRGIDELWVREKITSGLSSGEGLIYQVRDPLDNESQFPDAGVDDKRLLIVEEEFAQALKKMQSPTNILSATIRDAWDGNDLHPLTKTSPIRATEPHISIIGHITTDDLLKYFADNDKANGFGNRFLWFYVERSKCIADPIGVPTEELEPLVTRLKAAIEFARTAPEMKRDRVATAWWFGIYPELSEGKPGIVGALTSRGEAQVLRLSMLYALAECSPMIRFEHLCAALAIWEYCEDSVNEIFGERLGDPTADQLLKEFRENGEMDETRIRDLFGRHRAGAEIDRALDLLVRLGLAKHTSVKTSGRPRTIWSAT